jgi:hypothetical protein
MRVHGRSPEIDWLVSAMISVPDWGVTPAPVSMVAPLLLVEASQKGIALCSDRFQAEGSQGTSKPKGGSILNPGMKSPNTLSATTNLVLNGVFRLCSRPTYHLQPTRYQCPQTTSEIQSKSITKNKIPINLAYQKSKEAPRVIAAIRVYD